MVDTYVICPQGISFGWQNGVWICPGFEKWLAAWSTRPSTTESSTCVSDCVKFLKNPPWTSRFMTTAKNHLEIVKFLGAIDFRACEVCVYTHFCILDKRNSQRISRKLGNTGTSTLGPGAQRSAHSVIRPGCGKARCGSWLLDMLDGRIWFSSTISTF